MEIELMKIANNDLKAAKILYEKRLYAQAVFYLQQSVEKTSKAYGLVSKLIDEKELISKISHFPIRIHKKNIKKQLEGFNNFKLLSENYPKIKSIDIFKDDDIDEKIKETNKIITDFEHMETNGEDLIYLSSWNLNYYIRWIEYYFKESKKIYHKDMKNIITEKDLKEMKEEIKKPYLLFKEETPKKFQEAIESLDKLDLNAAENMMEIVIDVFSKAIPLTISSLYMSIIMHPHSIISRYPIKDETPIEIYNKRLPLIKKFPKLIEIQEKTIKLMNDYVNSFN